MRSRCQYRANLRGKCLGVLGLGNIAKEVARIGLAFGMTVIAWSQNLTTEIASAAGATLADKHALFRQADIVTIHLAAGDGADRAQQRRRQLHIAEPPASVSTQ
jgi:phosphoglycerate dehydrogenase-like enzyme